MKELGIGRRGVDNFDMYIISDDEDSDFIHICGSFLHPFVLGLCQEIFQQLSLVIFWVSNVGWAKNKQECATMERNSVRWIREPEQYIQRDIQLKRYSQQVIEERKGTGQSYFCNEGRNTRLFPQLPLEIGTGGWEMVIGLAHQPSCNIRLYGTEGTSAASAKWSMTWGSWLWTAELL